MTNVVSRPSEMVAFQIESLDVGNHQQPSLQSFLNCPEGRNISPSVEFSVNNTPNVVAEICLQDPSFLHHLLSQTLQLALQPLDLLLFLLPELHTLQLQPRPVEHLIHGQRDQKILRHGPAELAIEIPVWIDFGSGIWSLIGRVDSSMEGSGRCTRTR